MSHMNLYGTYEKLSDDGITQWHPAYLGLGQSLDACAARYRRFCRKYDVACKPGGRCSAWGTQCLPELTRRKPRRLRVSGPLLPFGGDWCQVQKDHNTPQANESLWLASQAG